MRNSHSKEVICPTIFLCFLQLNFLLFLPPQGPSETTPPNQTGFYELVSVLTHKGRSADSGHYVAWVKQQDGFVKL